MTKEEIQEISQWASQPRENVWRNWLALLRGKPGVTEEDLLAYKPSINVICEPMMGYTRTVDGVQTAVYISRERAIVLFQECLDIVRAFSQVNDLLRLASYRCQIDMDDTFSIPEVDGELFELAKRHYEHMSVAQLKRMEVRMPVGSNIRFAIELLRRRKERPVLQRAA